MHVWDLKNWIFRGFCFVVVLHNCEVPVFEESMDPSFSSISNMHVSEAFKFLILEGMDSVCGPLTSVHCIHFNVGVMLLS